MRNDGTLWCSYCKNEIREGEDYVVRKGGVYHPDCYELIQSDSYGIEPDEYSETESE
jgi:hypothetical protein